MKSRFLMCFAAITLLAAMTVPVRLAAQEHKTEHRRYKVIDLGTLGGTFSEPHGINNEDWVAGFANLKGNQNGHAFLWRHGHKTDLGTLGGPNSLAWVPGEEGKIPGQAETSTPDPLGEDYCGFGTNLVCLPFVWQNGVMTPLPTLGGDNGVASEINARGQVAGQAETALHDPTCIPPQVLQTEAVIWRNGVIQKQLQPFPGDSDAIAAGINDEGQATGISGTCSAILHGVVWGRDTVTDVGNLGGSITAPIDINNPSQVVGFATLPGDTSQHAFLWTKHGGMRDLGTLPGDTDSSTESINNRGQVAGVSFTSVSSRAFLWQNGVMKDLNTLTCPGSIFLANALGINDQGEIIGDTVTSAGDVHAYLASPTDDECDREAASSTDRLGSGVSPEVTLSENVRNLLRRRLGRRYRIFGYEAGPTE
jgi:probable HAF family extracellular repeat protein